MQVTLRNVKGIKQLTFKVPDPGVWIVTGLNGSGKTSLFAAIYRLKFRNAFPWYFRAGGLSTPVDRYQDAEIEYEIDGEQVTYRYGGQRWRASPRKNSNLLDSSGYPDVIYLEANATRVEPYANEIRSNRVYACKSELVAFLEYVLMGNKWRELKYVYTTRGGRGAVKAFLVQYKVGTRNYYFSEKSFSLGELCVLRLATEILGAPEGSLVLIDEVEMALHPSAQVRMLEKIQEVAREKNLTVLFSTHSSTLIKSSSRKRLIFLRPSAGVVTVVVGAYPACVLGDISSAGEVAVDFLLYVEDDQALMLSDELIKRYLEAEQLDPIARPSYRLVPVGGYAQVVALLSHTEGLIPEYVKRRALLDKDAESSIIEAVGNHQQPFSTQYLGVRTQVAFLPWTPEEGLVAFLESEVLIDDALDLLRTHFAGGAVNFRAALSSASYTAITSGNSRKQAKKRLAHFSKHIEAATGVPKREVVRRLYGVLVAWNYADNVPALRALLGPVFRAP